MSRFTTADDQDPIGSDAAPWTPPRTTSRPRPRSDARAHALLKRLITAHDVNVTHLTAELLREVADLRAEQRRLKDMPTDEVQP